jgi:hypothetical protein
MNERAIAHMPGRTISTLTPLQGSILQRRATNQSEPTTVPPIVHEALRSPGRPLDPATREFMESRFGHDFSHVRVHTDGKAAESAGAVNALAYTVGQDIVFGAGSYTPQTSAGQRLMAHELTHVVQQKLDMSSEKDLLEAEADTSAKNITSSEPPTISEPAVHGLLQRQEAYLTPPPQSIQPINLGRTAQLEELLAQIIEETDRSTFLRSELESLPPASSAYRARIEANLNSSRMNLIRLLEQRINLLRVEIASLHSRIGPSPTSSPEHPELESLGHELNSREQELNQHEDQLRPLRRWQTRREIQSIQSEVEQVNRDILALPPLNPAAPTSDISDPRVQELMNRRARLEQRQRRLAASLTSTSLRYRQADPRWGSRRYGTSANCTNVAAAGCGPTSLAILLNYLFQEDPEIAAGGDLEMVAPPTTADYAATHGRICNSGTVGDTMVTNVQTQWPGFHGSRITLEQAVTHLRSGSLIIFLCRNCTGQNAAGQNKSYGGHFMVLNGVNDDASQFNVIDPAGKNIVRISRHELSAHAAGLWTVVRK